MITDDMELRLRLKARLRKLQQEREDDILRYIHEKHAWFDSEVRIIQATIETLEKA